MERSPCHAAARSKVYWGPDGNVRVSADGQESARESQKALLDGLPSIRRGFATSEFGKRIGPVQATFILTERGRRFRDTFSFEPVLAGAPIERVSILLGHQSVRIAKEHYARRVQAGQKSLESDVQRHRPEENLQPEVHGGYVEVPAQSIPLKSRRRNGGG